MTENSDAELARQIELVDTLTNRLFKVLVVMLVAAIVFLGLAYKVADKFPLIVLCLFVGILGGFVGIQQRLKSLPLQDLKLISRSWVSTSLSPLAGGILAMLLYVLFVSGLLGGQLFPEFENIRYEKEKIFANFLETPAKSYKDIAKAIFWSFLAGYSERFVPNLLKKFEEKGGKKL